MKLYLINMYEAYQIAEKGITAIRELPKESVYYKYNILEETNIKLPKDYEMSKTNNGKTEIFYKKEVADMITEKKDKHYITSLITSQCIKTIKIWELED